jgi:hypothetical protein
MKVALWKEEITPYMIEHQFVRFRDVDIFYDALNTGSRGAYGIMVPQQVTTSRPTSKAVPPHNSCHGLRQYNFYVLS